MADNLKTTLPSGQTCSTVRLSKASLNVLQVTDAAQPLCLTLSSPQDVAVLVENLITSAWWHLRHGTTLASMKLCPRLYSSLNGGLADAIHYATE